MSREQQPRRRLVLVICTVVALPFTAACSGVSGATGSTSAPVALTSGSGSPGTQTLAEVPVPSVPVKTVRLEVAAQGAPATEVVVLAGTHEQHLGATRLPWSATASVGAADMITLGARVTDSNQPVTCRIFFDGVLVHEKLRRGGVACTTSVSTWDLNAAGSADGELGSLHSAAPGAAAGDLPASPRSVTLEADSSNRHGEVSYSTDATTPPTFEDDVTFPYSRSLPWAAGRAYSMTATGDVRTQAVPGEVVTCELKVDGSVAVLDRGRGAASCALGR